MACPLILMMCMSRTIFQKGQVLEVAIYDDMIVIVPAISRDNGAGN